jgi:hypothetical protein
MLISSSGPTTRKLPRRIACAALGALALLAVSSAPALAASACEGQAFSQPFAALGDYNSYTLVPGSQFNGPAEGWQLSGGAHVAEATRPDGSSGGVLELPPGAQAVSPPVCVTPLYPTARVFVDNAETGGSVTVAVAYANTKTANKPKAVTGVQAVNGGWTLSEAFSIRPQLLGGEESGEVRFLLTASSKVTSFQLYGLYVDPWMR